MMTNLVPVNMPLVTYLHPWLSQLEANAYQVTIKLRHQSNPDMSVHPHPVDIRLVRTIDKGWFIESIQVLSEEVNSQGVAQPNLNFNFLHNQFRQPDMGVVELSHPKVQELYITWQKTLMRQLNDALYGDISIDVTKALSPLMARFYQL